MANWAMSKCARLSPGTARRYRARSCWARSNRPCRASAQMTARSGGAWNARPATSAPAPRSRASAARRIAIGARDRDVITGNAQEGTGKRLVARGWSTADEIGPDGPVDRVGVFPEILVEDSSRERVDQGIFQGHAVHLAGAELLEIAADVGDALVGHLGAGLGRIVVADVDGLALDFPTVDFQDLVLQDGGVVVQRSIEDRPLGDLDESRRHLDAAPVGQLGIRARGAQALAPPGTPGRRQTQSQQEADHNGSAGAHAHGFFASCADGCQSSPVATCWIKVPGWWSDRSRQRSSVAPGPSSAREQRAWS